MNKRQVLDIIAKSMSNFAKGTGNMGRFSCNVAEDTVRAELFPRKELQNYAEWFRNSRRSPEHKYAEKVLDDLGRKYCKQKGVTFTVAFLPTVCGESNEGCIQKARREWATWVVKELETYED